MWGVAQLALFRKPDRQNQNRAGSTPRREVDESNYRGQGEGATPPLRAAHSTEP